MMAVASTVTKLSIDISIMSGKVAMFIVKIFSIVPLAVLTAIMGEKASNAVKGVISPGGDQSQKTK